MATTSSSRVTTHSKPQPVMAFPIKDWQNQLPMKKDTDHTGSSNGSCEFNVFHKRVKPPSPHTHRTGRQPPSPPVRLRDRYVHQSPTLQLPCDKLTVDISHTNTKQALFTSFDI